MQYSLKYLNKSTNLNFLKLQTLIENLNLIGFEVDDIFETINFSNNNNNINLILKIPANREDLLSEELLLEEIFRLFSLISFNIWNQLQKNYFLVLQKTYLAHYNSPNFVIKSSLNDLLIYNIELENVQSIVPPLWVQEKIKNFGYTPTKNIQDILTLTNIEWGQTINYKLSEQKEESFFVEQLSEEEIFYLPNGKKILCPKNSVVLKDGMNKIQTCLGYNSISFEDLNNDNQRVFLESIYYDIHLNSLNLNTINTKLSLRYLRKSCLDFFKFSYQRLLTILEILNFENCLKFKTYKTIGSNINLNAIHILPLRKKFFLDFLNTNNYQVEIFEKAGLEIICNTKTHLYFKILNNRKDLVREIDIIEEYSRFIGYKNFIEIKPIKIAKKSTKNTYKYIKEYFLNLGFNEIFNSSLQENTIKKSYSILLENPLNNDFFLLRSELSSKLVETFENNIRLGSLNTNFFEIGRVFKKIKNQLVEENRFGVVFQDLFEKTNSTNSLNWFLHKSFLENFLLSFGYDDINFEKFNNSNSIFHPTRSCLIKNGKNILGVFGQINPLVKQLKTTCYILELNLFYFKDIRVKSKIHFIKEVSKFPSIIKDLSFKLNNEINFSKLKTTILDNSKNLKNFYFFDIYFENQEPKNMNIGIRLEFQSNMETLTNKEIEKEILNIKDKLTSEFNILFLE